MIVRIEPITQVFGGTILSPRSKSSMQRACAAALLRRGKTEIIHPGHSQDDMAARDVIQKLGATLSVSTAADGVTETTLEVRSEGLRPLGRTIDCGESGLGIRMFTPIAALSAQALTIVGKGSLVTRPMHFFDEIFPLLGIQIQSDKGRLPLHIQGPLQPKHIEVDGSLSSQFLTGLLMAYSAAGASEVGIRVRDLKSKPYIDLTLDVMQAFGMHLPENRDYAEFYFPRVTTQSPLALVRYPVEGDWSGAAFLLVAAAIAGETLVEGLQANSAQADKAVLQALEAAGTRYQWEGENLRVFGAGSVDVDRVPQQQGPGSGAVPVAGNVQAGPLRAFRFDATECPDLFPPLVALAAYADGVSTIHGAERLTHKESNRALTLQQEFGKLGVQIRLDGDQMHVHGGHGVSGGRVHSCHDHRIAMALAVAGLRASDAVVIDEAQAIGKSYPDFYTDLQQLGAGIDYLESVTEHHA